MNTDKEFKQWFKKELFKLIDEQQKEIDLFEKALEEDESFLNFIEFKDEEQTKWIWFLLYYTHYQDWFFL